MFNTSSLLKTFITNECQSCYSVPSPPPCRRTGMRGLTRGTPQASATGQTQPIWIKGTRSCLQFQKDALFGLVLKKLGLSPVCCSRSKNKAAGRGVKVGVSIPDEGATAPHNQSVRIVPGFDLIFTFDST